MNEINVREVQEAITAADDALYHLKAARSRLNSAGNWGLLDIFGGGTITGLFKHGNMSKAEREIELAKRSLQKFSRELREVEGYSSIHINDFMTLADFFFDGVIADFLVQSQISNAKRQCDDAIRQVEGIRGNLIEMVH